MASTTRPTPHTERQVAKSTGLIWDYQLEHLYASFPYGWPQGKSVFFALETRAQE